MNDCIVIIPTYNEIENIESIIRSVLSQHKPFHILIVDDNSDRYGQGQIASNGI
jgi:dolichol-phosphate mannosyltransferase